MWPFKGQSLPWRSQNYKISERFLNKRLMYLNSVLDLWSKIFGYSTILWPSEYILAFKRPHFHLSALFWVKGSYKSSSGCSKSIFGSINFLICNFAFPATLVAFLTFMTLKLENNEIMALLTPNKPKITKNSRILTFLALWPLIWPFRPLSAFYIFPEILDTKEDQWYA